MNEYTLFSQFSEHSEQKISITTQSTEYNYIQVNKTVNFCPLQEFAHALAQINKNLRYSSSLQPCDPCGLLTSMHTV